MKERILIQCVVTGLYCMGLFSGMLLNQMYPMNPESLWAGFITSVVITIAASFWLTRGD